MWSRVRASVLFAAFVLDFVTAVSRNHASLFTVASTLLSQLPELCDATSRRRSNTDTRRRAYTPAPPVSATRRRSPSPPASTTRRRSYTDSARRRSPYTGGRRRGSSGSVGYYDSGGIYHTRVIVIGTGYYGPGYYGGHYYPDGCYNCCNGCGPASGGNNGGQSTGSFVVGLILWIIICCCCCCACYGVYMCCKRRNDRHFEHHLDDHHDSSSSSDSDDEKHRDDRICHHGIRQDQYCYQCEEGETATTHVEMNPADTAWNPPPPPAYVVPNDREAGYGASAPPPPPPPGGPTINKVQA